MKRGLFVVFVFLIFLFSIMFVSAGWFSDLFHKNKVTGNALDYTNVSVNSSSWKSGMVSWWKFDGNANDYFGIKNGTVSGATLINTSCKSGKCYSFDGINDYISLGYAPQYNIRQAITLSVWMKRTTNYNQTRDVMLLSRSPSWYFYDAYNSGMIRGDVYINGTRRAGIYSKVIPFDNNWYHVLYTYDSSTRLARMYQNGVLVGSVQLTNLSNYLIDSSTAGFSNIGYQTLGRGLILDEFMIWNRSLSEAEVSELYNSFSGCTPNCVGKQCGDDGCGGSCGNCTTGYNCNLIGQCVINSPSWQKGIILWLKMEGNALDSSNYSWKTADSGVSYINGKVGKGASVFSETKKIFVDPALDFASTNMTLSFWINVKNYTHPARQNPLGKAYGGDGTITLEQNGYMSFYFGSSGKNAQNYTNDVSGHGSTAGVWEHWTITRDRTSRKTQWYKNGVASGSPYIYSTSFNPVHSTNNLTIGDDYVYPLNGTMDEVIIWNRVLNSTEVQQVYNSFSVCTPNCVGKQCGENGCGGICGTCPTGYNCNLTGQCIVLKENGAVCFSDSQCRSGACDYDIFTDNYVEGRINTSSSDKYCHSNVSKCLFYAGWMQENDVGCTRCGYWYHDNSWDGFIDTCGSDSKWINYIDCNGSTPYCSSDSQSGFCNVTCVECTTDENCKDSNKKCVNNKCVIVSNFTDWKSGMVSWWKFDGNANDYFGRNNGTIFGVTLREKGCAVGQCYRFDGINDYVEMSNLSQAYSQMTYAYWFNNDFEILDIPTGSYEPIFYYTSGSDYGLFFGDDRFIANFYNSTTQQHYVNWKPSTINNSQWHHITNVYDADKGYVSLYLDGVLVGNRTYSPWAVGIKRILRLGRYGSYYYNGSIDEFMIWNRALNPLEIQQMYNSFSCFPNCVEKQCGDDGCGGSCGTCSEGYSCDYLAGKCFYKNYPVYLNVLSKKTIYSLGEQILLTDSNQLNNSVTITSPTGSVISSSSEENYYDLEELDSSLQKDSFKRYIIQFKEDPVIVQKSKLQDKANKNIESLESNSEAVKTVKSWFLLMPEDVDDELEKYSLDLKKNHERVKSRILSEVNEVRNPITGGIISRIAGKITGNSVGKENVKIDYEFSNLFNGISVSLSEEEVEKIKKIDEVKEVYVDYPVRALLDGSVPLIDADDVWKLDIFRNNCSVSGRECLTGKGVTIGIIDTGIDYTHPDLGGCFGNGCKVLGGYDAINNDNNPMDDNGHGTHCAAIAAGNGTLKGVAPDAKLYSFKVLDYDGWGHAGLIIFVLDNYVLDLDGDGIMMEDENDYLDIVSLSLGSFCGAYDESCGPDDVMSKAIDNLVDAGVVAVVAAGNEGPGLNTISSPGTARKAITVGASNNDNHLARFSSRGPIVWSISDMESEKILVKPDILAPGVDICAAEWDSVWSDRKCLDNNHVSISGTSMATPHVAGAVALIKQKNPSWTPDEIKTALKNTAIDLGYDLVEQGAGRIDVLNVIQLAERPVIAFLNETESGLSGAIDIYGTASGKYFQKYEVYYGNGTNWNLICRSNTRVVSSVLCRGFNPLNLIDGRNYELKLVVHGNNSISIDKGLFGVNFVRVNFPLNNDVLRGGDLITLRGVAPPGFYNLTVEFIENGTDYNDSYKWSNYGIKILGLGVNGFNNEPFALWNTTGLKKGFYNLKIKVHYPMGIIEEYVKEIYLDSSLEKGWPVRLDYYYSSSGVLPLSLSSDYIPVPTNSFSQENDINGIINLTKEEFINNMISQSEITAQGDYYHIGYLQTAVRDIDRDGDKEIIVFSGGNPPKLSVYNFEGHLFWEVYIGKGAATGPNLPFPLVGDLDNDGYDEIISYTFNKGYTYSEIYVFNHDSSLLWYKNVSRDYYPTMIMADLNLDGNKEIILKGNAGYSGVQKMIVVSNTGETLGEWYLSNSSWTSSLPGSPAVGNFDDDPELEIVSALQSDGAGVIRSPDGTFIAFNNTGVVYVHNMDGSLVKGWPRYTDGVPYSSPVVGDINNDGNEEIVLGLTYSSLSSIDYSYGGVYAFDKNGNVLQGWPVLKGYQFWSTPALGDVDKDGDLEISISRIKYFATYLFHHNGSVLTGWPKYPIYNDYYSSVMEDINGDGSLDIITTAGNRVYAWDLKGNTISGFPKLTEPDVEAPATIADIDKDGKLELVASSNYDYDFISDKSKWRGSIYVWELDSSNNVERISWPMYKHDSQLTGNYNYNGVLLPSILKNKNTSAISGTLKIVLQKENSSDAWIDDRVIINSSLTIPGNTTIDLANHPTYGWNSKNVRTYLSGEYRIYASFSSGADILNASSQKFWAK